MQEYNPITSGVTKIASLDCFWSYLFFYLKSLESLMEDQLLCMISLRWLAGNPDAFSLGVSQLEVTGLPARLYNLLGILDRRHVFQDYMRFCTWNYKSSVVFEINDPLS